MKLFQFLSFIKSVCCEVQLKVISRRRGHNHNFNTKQLNVNRTCSHVVELYFKMQTKNITGLDKTNIRCGKVG